MRKILFGVIITLSVLLVFRFCENRKENDTILKESSALIQKEINNVGKLIITEGHFSKIYDYKNARSLFNNLISSEKKALVVANADVNVSYDLSKIKFKIEEESKILHITYIPEPEIKIHPELEFYDLQQGYFNPFDSEDYNSINKAIKESFQEKVNNSNLKTNAKSRLLSELSKFYILTNSLGWTLQYNETTIENPEAFNTLKL